MSVAEKFIQQIVVFDVFLTIFISINFGFVFSFEVGDGKIKCVEREKEALLRLKGEFLDDYGRISSWGNEGYNQDCCRWRGVNCDKQTGNVIGLDLRGPSSSGSPYISAKPLRGKISPALQELKHLKYLDLSYNEISGGIPDFVASLSKLEYLNLSHFGYDFTTIFPHLVNFSSLNTLDLSYNTFPYVNSLMWLSHLHQLRYLAMRYVHLSNATDWLQAVLKLPFLQVLSLPGSKLPLPVPSVLPSVNSFMSLKTLDLSSNNLNNSIYTLLYNFSNLTHLDLSGNALDGHIPYAFGNMLSVAHLDLSQNSHQEGGLPRCFGNISNLKLLRVSSNRLDGQLLEIMKNLSCMTDSLEYLNLEDNKIGGSLSDIVANFTSLRELRLGRNKLNESIPPVVGELQSLVILDLSWNEIVGSVPDLFLLSLLRELYLSHNQLSGLTKFIGHLPKLEKLYINSNQFEGIITEVDLFKLLQLREMDLSFNNQLHMQISSNWIPPFQLNVIRLAHCKLGPRFPNWLQTQSNISELDLSASGISGHIPSWFWDQPALQSLNLSYNDMSGTIPDISRKMSALALIDLGSNSFNGPVPQLPTDMTTVDLSRNKFSGNISFACDNFDYLGYVDLSDNLFAGELPHCWKLRSLVRLNLAYNNFSGEIPSSIGSSQMMMRMLQLRNNHFTGKLPKSLEDCKFLRFIDVGGNNLSGEIPEWIGNSLAYISVLILRSNRFSGSIPSSICQLTDIQILDISQNKISGTIPKCINNLTALTKEGSPKQKITTWYWHSYIRGGVTVTINTSYDASAFLMWKGREFEYSSTLGLVKSIDLSINELVGEIPVEITSLVGLLGLNLSRNNLTGSIPMRIGQLRDINFLDLSKNKFSGKIPTSFSQLSHLGVLNLSYNNLSGRIPLDTQSQTFNSSAFIGNPGLCGSPLIEACPGNRLPQDPKMNADSEDEQHEDAFISTGFYISMGIGFVFGFWGVFYTLILNKMWRYAWFRFLESIFKN
ncbi:unnamed protein product [Withania somnifera]